MKDLGLAISFQVQLGEFDEPEAKQSLKALDDMRISCLLPFCSVCGNAMHGLRACFYAFGDLIGNSRLGGVGI